MKILYIHQYFNTPSMPGSTRSYEFAKRLVARGDTVYMVTTNWQNKSNLSYSLIDGIHVYWAPILYSNKMSYLKRAFIFIEFLWYIFSIGKKVNYDLIVASSTPLTIALPAIILKRLKGIRMVFEVRDMWPQLPIALGAIKSKIIIKIAKWLEKKTYYNSDHIVCLSSGMEKELSKKISLDKITVVTNLSDISGFRSYNKKKYISFPTNKNLILYAGAFGRINGMVYLVEISKAMKKINPNLIFLLAGDGYDKDNIIQKSKEYGVFQKTLYCIDSVPKDQMPSLLSQATITASFFINLPEMENNSANKFFDGLAAGKPIMINYGGWQADIIDNTGCGFVIPSNDAKESALQINKIINNKNLLKQMSKASHDLAYKFDIDTNYSKFEKVIDNVINL